jgi:putative transposase
VPTATSPARLRGWRTTGRARIPGGTFFFTVTLADRSSKLLVEKIARLREFYLRVQERHPFETIAICILPDHLHAIWRLPEQDADFGMRWRLIQKSFSRTELHPVSARRASCSSGKRESGRGAIGSMQSEAMPT